MENQKNIAIVKKSQSKVLSAQALPVQVSAESLISQAITSGASVDTIERLMTIRKDINAENAKKAFDLDMADLQGELPIIHKKTAGGQTNAGKVAYYYATFDSIISQTKEIIKKYGFSYMTKTETNEKGVKAIMITKHRMGHSETTDMTVPFGTKTNVMSEPQVVAAALTFAKRYAFCNAFGIMTGDADDDGKLSAGKKDEIKKEVTIQVARLQLESAKDLEELKYVWANMSVEMKTELKPFQIEIKEKLTPKKDDNN